MPQASVDFDLKLERPQVWSLLNDPQKLGRCVPGCEGVEVIGPDQSRWKVKISMGIISRTINARALVVARAEPERIALKIESSDGEINGSWDLVLLETGQGSTRVKLTADMSAGGAFVPIVNHIIKSQLPKMVGQFADCISKETSR